MRLRTRFAVAVLSAAAVAGGIAGPASATAHASPAGDAHVKTLATFRAGEAHPDDTYIPVVHDIDNRYGKVGEVVLWFNENTFQFHAQFRKGSQGSEVELQDSGYEDFRNIVKAWPVWIPAGSTSVNTGDVPWNLHGNGYWFRAQGWAGQTQGRNYTDSLSLYYDSSTGIYTLRQYCPDGC